MKTNFNQDLKIGEKFTVKGETYKVVRKRTVKGVCYKCDFMNNAHGCVTLRCDHRKDGQIVVGKLYTPKKIVLKMFSFWFGIGLALFGFTFVTFSNGIEQTLIGLLCILFAAVLWADTYYKKMNIFKILFQ